ncbi:hypothetical protein RRG08_014686 [Elysia crispata]|uniref:Uncharacterized protein n=1 Tax=Elysia crispata TaxID=231223 RepID=A0AAE0YI00_9GAST|nr:hypothetical protein RRG08_014686 [Elysia crispata]
MSAHFKPTTSRHVSRDLWTLNPRFCGGGHFCLTHNYIESCRLAPSRMTGRSVSTRVSVTSQHIAALTTCFYDSDLLLRLAPQREGEWRLAYFRSTALVSDRNSGLAAHFVFDVYFTVSENRSVIVFVHPLTHYVAGVSNPLSPALVNIFPNLEWTVSSSGMDAGHGHTGGHFLFPKATKACTESNIASEVTPFQQRPRF